MSHPSAETLAAYWLGDLPEADAVALEEHLFSCERCEAASARRTFSKRPGSGS